MKIVSFGPARAEQPGVLVDDDTIVPLVPLLYDAGYPALSTNAILAQLSDLQPEIASRLADAPVTVAAAEVRLGPPVSKPPKIIVLGGNYRAVLEQTSGRTNAPMPSDPLLILKPSNTVIGPRDPLIRPAQSEQLDYEIEIVVVIGRGGYRIPRERAYEHVAGYMIGNDVTARDILAKDIALNPMFAQITRAKAMRTGAPTGPWLVTTDEIPDPHELELRCWINGELRQDGSSQDMILDIPAIVEDFSSILELEAGDIIFTGTTTGSGAFQNPPAYLFEGDLVRMEITGLGVMETPILDEKLS